MTTAKMIEAATRAMSEAEHCPPDNVALVGTKVMRCWEARVPAAKAALIAGLRVMSDRYSDVEVSGRIDVWLDDRADELERS